MKVKNGEYKTECMACKTWTMHYNAYLVKNYLYGKKYRLYVAEQTLIFIQLAIK